MCRCSEAARLRILEAWKARLRGSEAVRVPWEASRSPIEKILASNPRGLEGQAQRLGGWGARALRDLKNLLDPL